MTHTGGLVYGSADALRKALKDRFSASARSGSTYSVSELQRHFAYDRALARCFSGTDADRWVLKGAGALLARLDEARHSKDLDLFYTDRAAAEEEAFEALASVLRRDLGDFFTFETTRTVPLPEAAKGRRVYLVARLGAKPYASFHVDLVVGTAMSGEPELVAPITSVEIAGLIRPQYRAFPLVDHISDKLIATVESHQQAGQIRPSSRVKDLVDLALIARSQVVDGQQLRRAIHVGCAHRAMAVPDRFTVPDEVGWPTGSPAGGTRTTFDGHDRPLAGLRCRVMSADSWLADTRTSYDTVAGSYADLLRDALPGLPYLRAALGLFAETVQADGGGPLADIGCGPGHVTAHLHDLGLDAFGIDLSPAMIEVARRDHPGLRFEVGSMTELALADESVAGMLAWWSLIHVPDDVVPTVLGHFHRVLRPGGRLLVGFHVGDTSRLKTEGYGGHPMKVHVHLRRPGQVADLLRAAGFTVEAEWLLDPDSQPGAIIFARRR